MGKLDKFRKIMALPEVVQSVELSDKLKDLYTDYLELLEKNNELSAKLKENANVSDIKKNAKIHNGFYTLNGVNDISGDEIPFCLNCLFEYGLQIPMNYGIVERGLQDALSGKVFKHNTYGLICNKCKIKLATGVKEKKDEGI